MYKKRIHSTNLASQFIDFVLVTALTEERDAILNKLPGYRKVQPADDDIHTYFQAELSLTFPDGSSGTYSVVVMCLLGMGRVQAATATADAIRRWHPRYILLLGIAGGFLARDIKIGDILIGDQIVDYEQQKLTPQGSEIRWEVYRADARLLSACMNFMDDSWLDLIHVSRPDSGIPERHVGAIASGDKVIAFSKILRKYQKVWPKLIGVEMEAAGVATAAFQSTESPGFFMIRGVSDLADENKGSLNIQKWRLYVCDVVASFTIALLKSGPVPFSERIYTIPKSPFEDDLEQYSEEEEMDSSVSQLVIHEFITPSQQHDSGLDTRLYYLRMIARIANHIPWANLLSRNINQLSQNIDQAGLRALNLSDIYVPLSTTRMRLVDSEEDLRRFLIHQGDLEIVPVLEEFSKHKNLLLMGDPGSGKSTFVHYLAFTFAMAQLNENSDSWLDRLKPWWTSEALFPIFVDLHYIDSINNREFAPKGSLLLKCIRRLLSDWGMESFSSSLQNLLSGEAEHCLILIDGLDEVSGTQRRHVAENIEEFAELYPQHHYVVTCRPYAYFNQSIQLHDFYEAMLAPFSKQQIDEFINKWYLHLSNRGYIENMKAIDQAVQLTSALEKPDLFQIASRPLLLTVMAELHTYSGQFPDDRILLYKNAVQLLLRHWENRFSPEDSIIHVLGIPGLKINDLEQFMHFVAFQVHAQTDDNVLDIDEADLRKWLAPFLGGSWDKAGLFIDYIRDRAGLLVKNKLDTYSFPHRSFQEFLSACYLVNQSDYPRVISQLLKKDWERWHEVFVFAEAYAARFEHLSQAISALNSLVPRSPLEITESKYEDFQCALLGGEALLEMGIMELQREEAENVTVERICQWLERILITDRLMHSRERIQAGLYLGKLGDTRQNVMSINSIEFSYVPAGEFIMGEDKFAHSVKLRDYWIGRLLISNSQFNEFVKAEGYKDSSFWVEAEQQGIWKDGKIQGRWDQVPRDKPFNLGVPFILPNHPVVSISWYEMLAFTRWLTQLLRKNNYLDEYWKVSLPSEAEWEKAARGGLVIPQSPVIYTFEKKQSFQLDVILVENSLPQRCYPWGDEFDLNNANIDKTGINTPCVIGCYVGGHSPYGLLDMSGNVWEWTRSIEKVYPYSTVDGRENISADHNTHRVFRGGSFAYEQRLARCVSRHSDYPDFRRGDLGFRVAIVKSV